MFQVIATAPGYGLSWHLAESMYALAEPFPLDIQDRHPLGEPIFMDLTFRPAEALSGAIVDEAGKPLRGVEVSIHDADLLDIDGLETSRNLNTPWGEMPGELGRTVTGQDGRFRIDGLPSEACFWVWLKRPEFPTCGDAFYAATTERPPGEHREPRRHSGRERHKFESGTFTRTFPTPQRLQVRVVDDATGEPVPGVRVGSPGESLATGIHAHGTSDEQGRLVLELPPGTYGGVYGDPPLDTNYIRTYRRDLTVAEEPAKQPYELRMQPGFELLIEATSGVDGHGVAEAQFWLVPEDQTAGKRPIQPSTFGGASSWTDDEGRMRAVLTPEVGPTYRVAFAGIRRPNYPESSLDPDREQDRFEVEPERSEPFRIEAGKTLRLRFRLTARDP